ncbi:hypothetical protein DsansV1_C34g0226491 [Dioscorea sansibarensis]
MHKQRIEIIILNLFSCGEIEVYKLVEKLEQDTPQARTDKFTVGWIDEFKQLELATRLTTTFRTCQKLETRQSLANTTITIQQYTTMCNVSGDVLETSKHQLTLSKKNDT